MAFVAKLTPNADKLLFYTTIRSAYYSQANGILLDSIGNPILYGETGSGDFPLKNAFLTTITSAFGTGFITKFSADGKTIIHSSYYGGSGGSDAPYGGVVAADDGFIFNGYTSSHDIPIKNALQPHFGGGTSDCFVAKVDSLGSLVFSTYFGGSGTEYCRPIALGPGGSIYFGCATFSDDLPLKDPIQSTPTAVAGYYTPFLARLSADGSKLEYGTLLGGGSPGELFSIAFNSKGEIYLAATAYPQVPFPTTANAFESKCEMVSCGTLIKLDPTGRKILISTYLSASANGGGSLVIGPDDSVYIAGSSNSGDFPSLNSLFPYTPGRIAYNGLLMKFLGDLRTLVFSTFLGPQTYLNKAVLDSAGRVYIAGQTASEAYPVKNAFQKTFGGGGWDGVLLRVSDTTVAATSPLTVTPSQIKFKYVQGGAPIKSQTLQVTSADTPVSFTASANAAWVTVLPQAATTPVALSVGAAPLSKYIDFNIRVCRPYNLRRDDLHIVFDEVLSQIGYRYDIRHLVDLMRYFLPVSLVPRALRRNALEFGSGLPTQVICSTLIARAFERVRYPIVPQVTRHDEEETPPRGLVDWVRRRPLPPYGLFHMPPITLTTPRDFDISPYFEVVQPTIAKDFDYHKIAWAQEDPV